MRRQIINQDGTLNIYLVTVTGLTKDGPKTEHFPYTLQYDKEQARRGARGMWLMLHEDMDPDFDQQIEEKVEEHEVLDGEVGTADRIRNAQDELRLAVNQHYDSANGEHYAILNARIDPAINELIAMVEKQ
jgi:hypothetical protein